MFLAFVIAMGGVGFEDVAVAGFEEAEDAGFVDYAGPQLYARAARRYLSLPYFSYSAQNLE